MSYISNFDLPETIQRILPSHAKDIYREAFNKAYEKYKDSSKRKYHRSLESTASAVAWNAVKQEYLKDKNGNWVRK